MYRTSQTREITDVLAKCRMAFAFVAVTSGLINILYLTGSFFMLEVYDRVIPSRSVPTLVGLGLLALALYAFQGAFEMLRSRILGRISSALDETLAHRVFDVVARAPLRGQGEHDGALPLRDFDQLRSFLAGSGPSAFFDLPWVPIYIVICSLFHPLIGVATIVGLVILFHADHDQRLGHQREDQGERPVRLPEISSRGGRPAERRGSRGHGHAPPVRGALDRRQS